MSIKKVERADGSVFQVYERRDNKKTYVGSFDSRREALAAQEEFRTTQRKIERGELPAGHDHKRTVAQATTEWLASLEKQRSRSYRQYENRVTRYVLPTLGGVAITLVTKAHVMRWRDDQATKFAPATVNGNLTCMSSAFSYFVDMGWLAANPCHGVSQVESPDRVYTWLQSKEEITRLLVECPKGIREIVTVALATGMRLDELLHLQWTDVDLERRLITVHRGRQGTVKSGKARRLPILNTLLPLLRELALKRGGDVLVFPGRRGAPRTKPGVWYPFKQAVNRAGLSRALRFHDLRHTFASHWVLDAGDIFRLSRILGHSSVTITQNVYAHLVPDAWEQDYHRVNFPLPGPGMVHAITQRRPVRRIADDLTQPTPHQLPQERTREPTPERIRDGVDLIEARANKDRLRIAREA